MESDAALEWIAQQCETTYPPPTSKTKVDVSKSLNHGVDVHKLWNHHLAEDQQGLCRWLRMDKLNGKAYASELVGTE